ncbi:MAG TPA: hypothetical protein VFB81_12930, partial [Myxococcales bacterium]|nr:hypothetical protein [Myxococcales bacterium]
MALAALAVGLRALTASDALRDRVRRKLVAELTSRFPGATLGGRVEIGWLGQVSAGPVELADRPGAPPLLSADQISVRPSYGALLSGRLEPASVSLHEVHLALDALRERPAAARATGAEVEDPRRALSLSVQVDRLFLHHGSRLLLAPLSAAATVRREATGKVRASAAAALADGGTARAWLTLERGRRAALSLELRGAGTGALSEDVLARVPVGTLRGGLSLDARLASEDGLATVTAEWTLRGDDLHLAGPRLAMRPVGPVSAGFQGKARLDLRGRRLEVGPAELWLGPAATARVSLSA